MIKEKWNERTPLSFFLGSGKFCVITAVVIISQCVVGFERYLLVLSCAVRGRLSSCIVTDKEIRLVRQARQLKAYADHVVLTRT